ncbi:CHAD domain-containing protein [Actinokineospora iranica]|uniref:CHAD domain-containing protein n=1 Tax=Actinokineospora iranica TaxID=1271860 RepID=A0A1G6R754_9PSEU|nr:CHAD domain-containing protein [Actinokineospora iranica]SDD00480.1 CHAD domain-containing protein [Actinokineospora iranica]
MPATLGDRVRARLHEQADALVRHQGAEAMEDVHQMRVAVRRARAALKAGLDAPELDAELRWLGTSLGAVRDLDVQLDHLRAQAEGFSPDELGAVEELLRGLVAERRAARRRMMGTLRSKRYKALLESLRTTAAAEAPPEETPTALLSVIRKPHRKLMKAATALGEDPPDDDLHELRIHGKRLRYAAEMAEETAKKQVRPLVKATKRFQDILGDHQDATIAEATIRRLVNEIGDGIPVDVVFVAGRLVERQRARKTVARAEWRSALAEVDTCAQAVLASATVTA